MDRQVSEWNNTAVETPQKPPRWRLAALSAATLVAFLFAAIGFFSPPRRELPKLNPGESSPAFAAEIRVHKDGSLLVTENTRAVFDGTTQRHGIQRRVAAVYLNEEKKEVPVSFSGHRATIQMLTEPPSQPQETGVNNFGEETKFATYRIGNPEIILGAGTYDFSFQFNVSGLVHPLNGGRSTGFVWNVTGGSLAPLDSTQLRVQLPPFVDTQTTEIGVFLGLIEDADSALRASNPNSISRDVAVSFERSPDEKDVFVTFKPKRPLNSLEHFVVKVGWPPGFLDGGL